MYVLYVRLCFDLHQILLDYPLYYTLDYYTLEHIKIAHTNRVHLMAHTNVGILKLVHSVQLNLHFKTCNSSTVQVLKCLNFVCAIMYVIFYIKPLTIYNS